MGGEFVIRKLLQIKPHIRAIVASGYIHNHILTDHQPYGFKGAITKAFMIARRKKVLTDALSL